MRHFSAETALLEKITEVGKEQAEMKNKIELLEKELSFANSDYKFLGETIKDLIKSLEFLRSQAYD